MLLTDMVRDLDGGGALIERWFKTKDTVLFWGVWEQYCVLWDGLSGEAIRLQKTRGEHHGKR
jgi:hypothetical protein